MGQKLTKEEKPKMVMAGTAVVIGALGLYYFMKTSASTEPASKATKEETEPENPKDKPREAAAPPKMTAQEPATTASSNTQDELDFEGKYSKENLKRLLTLLSLHIKTIYLRTKHVLDSQLETIPDLLEE